jgi:hypothetical protein
MSNDNAADRSEIAKLQGYLNAECFLRHEAEARAEAAEADAKALREALQGLAVGGMTPVWYETKARAALAAHEDKA